MNRFLLFEALLCFGLTVVAADAEVRDFRTQDGKSVRGEIESYKLQTDKLAIKTEGGKTVQLKADDLVDDDYVYVRDWDSVRLFSQNTHFRMYFNGPESLNKWSKILWRRPPGNVEAQQTYKIDHNRLGYEIKFDNQTGYDLENVELKYNLFYMQERMDYRVEEKVPDIVVRPCLERYAIVPSGKNNKFASKTIVLRRKEIAGAGTKLRYLEGEGRFLKSEMIGAIFRATITTRSGLSTVREIRMPKDLSEEYVWVEPTAENIVWADDSLDEREDVRRPPTLWVELGGSGEGG
ncbi:hypothetical protein PDESU_03350 [Pontiella desulfatans]|uniref:SLA1 homology domain-containing protein n=1 Tax=Pontiella desulfatans TaxID=2750659 RepID=A0A6C2U5G9_PONDE|nr:hypothetical protein [Pontiella desulfatans]VGO14781.1 hypothetical protein PDESU_03350 [Pontiella desulfatans]